MEDKNKTEKVVKTVKESAVVRANGSGISPKHSYAICDLIRGKTPEKSIQLLEKVLIKKFAVQMNNREVAHRKGNLMAGRYPINAAKEFIHLLKQLKANAVVNGIENPVITLAFANRASRPYRRHGVRAKRTNIYIEVKEKKKGEKK